MIYIDMDELKARGSKSLISAELTALIMALDDEELLTKKFSGVVAEARRLYDEARETARDFGMFGDEIGEDTEA